MPDKSFKKESRIDWHATTDKEDTYIGHERIKLGCLMRIADATEAMAKNFTDLQMENIRLAASNKELHAYIAKLQKRIAGYKGAINRMKKLKRKS